MNTTKTEVKTYTVTATPRYQAWNGSARTIEVRAATAKEAISRARRQAWAEAMFSKEDGAISYRAERVIDYRGDDMNPTIEASKTTTKTTTPKLADVSDALFNALTTCDRRALDELAELVESWKTTYHRSYKAAPPFMRDVFDAIREAQEFNRS